MPITPQIHPAPKPVPQGERKSADPAPLKPDAQGLRQKTLAAGQASGPELPKRRAYLLVPQGSTVPAGVIRSSEYWAGQVKSELEKITIKSEPGKNTEFPGGTHSDVLVGADWWSVRRPLENYLALVGSQAVDELVGSIVSEAVQIRDPRARDQFLAKQLGDSASALASAFAGAQPVLQALSEHVKALVKTAPGPAASFVAPNAVLVCGVAAAARSLQTRAGTSPREKAVLGRLREVAHALAQNRPEGLTGSLRWASQRERLTKVLAAAEMSLRTTLDQAFKAPLRAVAAGAIVDSKHSAGPNLAAITADEADQPPPLLPVEPGLSAFVAPLSSTFVEAQPIAPKSQNVDPAAATPGQSSTQEVDDRLDAPEFHTLNQPPKTPPQAGPLPVKKSPAHQAKQGPGPSPADFRNTRASALASEVDGSDSDDRPVPIFHTLAQPPRIGQASGPLTEQTAEAVAPKPWWICC